MSKTLVHFRRPPEIPSEENDHVWNPQSLTSRRPLFLVLDAAHLCQADIGKGNLIKVELKFQRQKDGQ